AAELRRLSLPLRAPDRRRVASVASGGVLRCCRAAASPPRSPPHPAAVDQRKRGDRAGLVEPRAGVLARVGREGRAAGRLTPTSLRAKRSNPAWIAASPSALLAMTVTLRPSPTERTSPAA